MLSDIFQMGPLPANQMFGTYDFSLVIISYLVASFASYVALDVTGRIRDVGNSEMTTMLWVVGGAFAMGAGIWSMHFVGMLAFTMNNMKMSYDLTLTMISFLVAIMASGFALLLLKSKVIKLSNFILGGIIMGLAIASMHYIGMEAMKVSMDMRYLPGLFTLSIIIAIVASEAALWLALKSNQVIASIRLRLKIISALIMGAAIAGMHYTGMAATVFTPLPDYTPPSNVIDPHVLAIGISMLTFCILSVALFLTTSKEAKNQQLLATARQAGMAEVAASVLHNVGNVLNSVNTSANIIAQKISVSRLDDLEQLNNLLKTHQNDIGNFITKDPNGAEIPNFIDLLSKEWMSEKASIVCELNLLIEHIEHIKNIISMQQNLSKVKQSDQVVSIEDVINEALMIIGLENKLKDITIEKHIDNIKPVLVNKVKLLQILVNLIKNAKDSLVANNSNDKRLSIYVCVHHSGNLHIKIVDNGIGIAAPDLVNIFSYGYTTKKDGHGFGLHTSALDAKDLGGNILVNSEGKGKGSTFILEMPYTVPKYIK